MVASDVALFIEPLSYHFLEDRLFALQTSALVGENSLAPHIHLRDWFSARGVPVHTADLLERGEVRASVNVLISYGMRERVRRLASRPDVVLSAFFVLESPVVDPPLFADLPEMAERFKRVYAFSDTESLVPFTKRAVPLRQCFLPFMADGVREDLWKQGDRRFLVMINHNKVPALRLQELYSERPRAVEFFARFDEIDLYGQGWDEVPYQLGPTWKPGTLQKIERFVRNCIERIRPIPELRAARRVYKGTVPSKLATLAKYTYSICFDNTTLNGWITEKIFDCFVAGTIPVYWGAPDVTDYIPADCFIDMRQFNGYEELRAFLKSRTPAQIEGYREAARAFMTSPAFLPFSKVTFTDRIARIVEEDTGVSLRLTAA